MKKDRFTDYDDEVAQLVLDFERTIMKGKSQFYDVDELEMIIDYYLEVGDREPLIQAIMFAEQLYPDSTEVKIRRAHWMISNGDFKGALDMLKRLEEVEPENTDVAYSLGVTYGALGQHERAIQYYQKAATDGWQLGRIYTNIAEEYYNMNQYDRSIEYLRQALSTDNFEPQILYNYLDIMEQLNRCDDEIPFLRSFVEQNPYCKEGWLALGGAYRAVGLMEQAADAVEYAIAIDKHFVDAYYELSYIQEDMGQVGEAATSLLRILEAAEDPDVVYRAIGELYARNNNFDTAITYFKKSIDSNPSNPGTYAQIAICTLHLGDVAQAQSWARKAMLMNPDDPDVLCAVALCHDAKGNYEAASEYFERLIQTGKCSEAHYKSYVAFLYDHADYEVLIPFAQESLEALPHDTFYGTYLAAACFCTNRYAKARAALADISPELLHAICPQMFTHPRFAPLLLDE